MQIVVLSFVIVGMLLLTEEILYLWIAIPDKCVFAEGSWLDKGYIDAINDSIDYVWWYFPIIYVFWPSGNFCLHNSDRFEHKDVVELFDEE